MATSRRSPSARPAAGAGTARRPGAGRAARPAARAPKGGTTAAARPRTDSADGPPPPPPPRRPQPKGGRPSVTGRAAVLALVLAVLLVSYAYPLRAWFDQHRERVELEREQDELTASVEQLEQELRLWEDPAYVAAQARERLGFVLPGEQSYIVLPDPDAPDETTSGPADGLPPAGEGTWYERLWASVTFADSPPPDPEAPVDDGDTGE
ncbi:septum formation initiator family protein [Jiangella ureilytica]|uniref:Septum formation initiator family protein n=1 Tax=Jiangella ureilytica TaxID=2530374 RepID=A0A4R4RSZ3_9ACTN|nr:septum formation initiator family protein [Jiangella ureilytica]TDC53080.1 septum formation initiator family protein [Jiangella ureilytica]